MSDDWGDVLASAALELRGEPLRRAAGGAEWRYGRKGSLAVHVAGPRAGSWRDHEADQGGGVLEFLEHIGGMTPDAARQWLRDRRPGVAVKVATRSTPPPKPRPPQDLGGYALQLWRTAGDVPAAPDTPARRWLAGTGGHGPLWRLDVPMPAAVRWIPSVWWDRDVGAFVAALAPLTAWRAAWPAAPEPCAVQLVYVAADGEPARDGDGLNKRTFGSAAGTACLIGTAAAGERVQVCEGVADGLSLGSRNPSPAVVLVGTAGYRADATRRGLSDAAHVEIWTDQDGPGVAAAADLAVGLDLSGVPVTRRIIKRGKDPAAAGGPFPMIDVEMMEIEARRAAAADGLPLAEALRQVAALLMEAASLDSETDEEGTA